MVWTVSKGVLSTQRKRAKVAAFMAVFLLTIASLASGLIYFVKQAYATTASNVVINEVMANPSSGHEWVELYNPTSSVVDMSDWRIKHDSVGTNFGGVFSGGTTIAPHGFYVQEDDGQLPNSGATVKLFVSSAAESANTPLDTLTYPSLSSGESYGLTPNGDLSAPQVFATPTKGSANTLTSGPVEDITTSTYYGDLQTAIDSANVGDTIQINSDLAISSRVNITKQLTIDGQGHTLSPTFTKTSNSNNATLEVVANNITIKNLTIDGSGGTDLHGINTYQASSSLIDNVTIKNNNRDGLVVNGSDVTVNNITTSNNGWGGIDVDQGSGVTAPSTLTVNGTSTHSEPTADILVDDKTNPNVNVVDTNNQYNYTDLGNVRIYRLKLATPTHISPANNSFKTTANQTLIDWSDVSSSSLPVKYKYESSHLAATNLDGSFVSPVYTSGLLTSSQIPTPGTPAGVYYWHVKAMDSSGRESDWSSPWELTVDNTAPNTPTPINPNSDTNPFYTNTGFTQSWSNESASGAVKYNYQSCYQATEPSGDTCLPKRY